MVLIMAKPYLSVVSKPKSQDTTTLENRVLAVLIHSPGAAGLLATLKPEFFTAGAHRLIFTALQSLGTAADVYEVARWLQDHGTPADVAHFASLIENAAVEVYRPVIGKYAAALVDAHFTQLLHAAQADAGADVADVKRLIDARDTTLAALNTDNALITVTARALQSMLFDPPCYAVPDLLPEGLCLLGGSPKVGKSWLALGLADAVAAGGLALGKIAVKQGRVLYMALEDTPRRLQGRLAAIHPDGGTWPELLELKTEWPRGQAGADLIGEWLSRHADARLVIVDTLGRIRTPARGNGTSYAEDYDELARFKAVADEFGICLLLITHLRKMSADDPFDQVTGTAGITGAADATLLLKRARGEQTAILHATGRDIEERELALSWKSCVWQITGDAEDLRLSDEKRLILDYLADHPNGRKVADISKDIGKGYTAIHNMLTKLCADGKVSQDSHTKAYKLCC